jgi:hypothetical protein
MILLIIVYLIWPRPEKSPAAGGLVIRGWLGAWRAGSSIRQKAKPMPQFNAFQAVCTRVRGKASAIAVAGVVGPAILARAARGAKKIDKIPEK